MRHQPETYVLSIQCDIVRGYEAARDAIQKLLDDMWPTLEVDIFATLR